MKLKSPDVILLLILVNARVRIDTLADLVARKRVDDILRVPWIGSLLSPQAMERMADWLTDPITLLLITATFLLVAVYVILDVVGQGTDHDWWRAKWAVAMAIVLCTVVAGSLFLIFLRHATTPASYTHDGGVIQTEEATKLILAGRNPYVEDYLNTPMADWGLDFKSALYHYPYLPFTFLMSTPAYLLSQVALGWYDQRFLYLLMFLALLVLASASARGPVSKLSLVMILGLNPIMGSDIIYGMNDVFVLFWIVLTVYLLSKGRLSLSMVAFALACASKPTAWFLAPFLVIYLYGRVRRSEEPILDNIWATVKSALPAALVFCVLILPFAAWDLGALVDDVWAWSSGTAEVAYQIRGWGFSNLVLALGLVSSRLDYFPFWALELLTCVPLLGFLVWWQFRRNNLSVALYSYGTLLLVFFYFSRFLNENYLGYIVAVFALAYFVGNDDSPGVQDRQIEMRAATEVAG